MVLTHTYSTDHNPNLTRSLNHDYQHSKTIYIGFKQKRHLKNHGDESKILSACLQACARNGIHKNTNNQ
jgi:hypothetical protein